MLLIRSKNPRRCQAENPLKLLSEFPGPALINRKGSTRRWMKVQGQVTSMTDLVE
jgi:hypothetical protein